MSRDIAFARWAVHANGVNPSKAMRRWLTDRASLTVKLIERSQHFRVHRLSQKLSLCLADEYRVVKLQRRICVQEREVLLECDGRPVVFAHTVVPTNATATDWPFFSALGERSLGTTLFGDPLVQRGDLHFSRLPDEHPLAQRARKALCVKQFEQPLFARRCLFRRKKGLLLVTEVFLPDIVQLLPRT
jgi:chorismate--pyruvate lyase